ncbi:MAG: dihydropteroate synthase, partial [Desulfopila sp.]
LDSPDPKILEMAFALVDTPPLVNSISLEQERFDTMLPFLKDKVDKQCSIIALCMDDHGMPASSFEIYSRAKRLIEELEGIGMAQDNIYIDPLVQPISTDAGKGVMVLEAVRGITTTYPAVHITGGLSNISYGLPERRMINRVFLTLMMGAGMDSAILDPLDDTIIAAIKTADMLLGKDSFCMEYLKNVRAGKIVS